MRRVTSPSSDTIWLVGGVLQIVFHWLTDRWTATTLTWFYHGGQQQQKPCFKSVVYPSWSAENLKKWSNNLSIFPWRLCCFQTVDDKNKSQTPVVGKCLKNDTRVDILLVSYWSHLQSDWFLCGVWCPAEIYRLRRTRTELLLCLILFTDAFVWAQPSPNNNSKHPKVLLRERTKFHDMFWYI